MMIKDVLSPVDVERDHWGAARNQNGETSSQCLNLKAIFGDKYRITKDPGEERLRVCDPVYQIIPCRYGEIYPYGGEYLVAMVTSQRIVKKMRRMSDLSVVQDCADAVVFKFHISNFNSVAKLVQPRKRRQKDSETMRIVGKKTAYKSRNDLAKKRSVTGL